MSGEIVSARRLTRRRVLLFPILLTIPLALVALMARESRVLNTARSRLSDGRSALLRDNPEEARRHLEECLALG